MSFFSKKDAEHVFKRLMMDSDLIDEYIRLFEEGTLEEFEKSSAGIFLDEIVEDSLYDILHIPNYFGRTTILKCMKDEITEMKSELLLSFGEDYQRINQVGKRFKIK